jgi:hypothetical protein
MSQNYQHGYLRRARRKSGSHPWEFLWREKNEAVNRVRRTAIVGTIEQYPTKELASAAAPVWGCERLDLSEQPQPGQSSVLAGRGDAKGHPASRIRGRNPQEDRLAYLPAHLFNSSDREWRER